MFVLRAYNKDTISEVTAELDLIYTISSNKDADIFVPNLNKPIYAKVNNTGWGMRCDKDSFINTDGFFQPDKKHEETLVVDKHLQLALTAFNSSYSNCKELKLDHCKNIIIGRNVSSDVALSDKQISGKHLSIRIENKKCFFKDLRSSNGTYHNNRKSIEGELAVGDTIVLGMSKITRVGDALVIYSNNNININLELSEDKIINSMISPNESYPYLFKQSPRTRESIPTDTIEIEAPPSLGGKPVINWINVLLAPVSTVAVTFLVSVTLTGMMGVVYFTLPMTIVGVIMSIVRYNSEKKKHTSAETLRMEKYQEYLNKIKDKLSKLSDEQSRILSNENPSISKCSKIIKNFERIIWDRRGNDEDFLSLRIGSGTIPSNITVNIPREHFKIQNDDLEMLPAQILGDYEKVDNCPILIDLKKQQTCGIIGNRENCVKLGKNLIIQAATHHSYEDLKLVVLCERHETSEWEFSKWLPHIYNDTKTKRYIADNANSISAMLDNISTIIDSRYLDLNEDNHLSKQTPTPFYLFICATSSVIVKHPIMRALSQNDTKLGVGAIFLFDEMHNLPRETQYIIETTKSTALLYKKEDVSNKQYFTIDELAKDQYMKLSRAMSPIRLELEDSHHTLPQSITFLQGYGIKTPKDININYNWNNMFPEESMLVPIGIKKNGEKFNFDIHEKRHGPHGIVAGMTGFGKSEMVQSWILSMAVKFSPENVSFVIIDFKGTGLLLPFKNLPHLAGTISDLDTTITRNLIALENELTRRKTLFDKSGVRDITAYLKLLREGKVYEKLSYLFIVIDEFAEFKVQFPEFIEVINRVFSIGRTLGVHILLLTQKPANAIDDKMNANTRFRWCLKVANSADSQDMIKCKDAAKIMNPGRAYVQVGENEVFEEIQTFWSGATYTPSQNELMRKSDVSIVTLNGDRVICEADKTTGFRADKNEIDAVIECMDSYVRKNDIPRAKAIWTQKLPDKIYLEELLQIAFDGEKWNETEIFVHPEIGVIDDPRSQVQYPFQVSFSTDGSIAIYGAPGTGKTTLLQTTIMSTALSYSPKQVNLYLLDFGGGSLQMFKKLPHVGDVMTNDNDEKIKKFVEFMSQEMISRREKLSKYALINISSYREITGESFPEIIVAIDNFASMLENYPELDIFIQSLVRDGGGYGIYVMMTASTYNSIPFRISQNIKSCIALRMADKNDYTMIVGQTRGLIPERVQGRGLVRHAVPMELQIALPISGDSEVERISNINKLIQLMNQKWVYDRAKPIPVTPDVVVSDDYCVREIVVGISHKDMSCRCFDFENEQFFLISEAVENMEFFECVARQAIKKTEPCNIIYHSNNVQIEGASHLTSEAFDEQISKIIHTLNVRKNNAAEKDLLVEEYPYILILIEDLKQCFDSASDETIRRLANIITLGRRLNIVLIARGNIKDISQLYHGGESFTMNLVEQASVCIIGANVYTHAVFKTNLDYNQLSEDLKKNDGYLVKNKNAEKIKLVNK